MENELHFFSFFFCYTEWKAAEADRLLLFPLFLTLFLSLPVLVALYIFSMGKAEPRPYSNTLERAGISWVVVTNTFTQLGLEKENHGSEVAS